MRHPAPPELAHRPTTTRLDDRPLPSGPRRAIVPSGPARVNRGLATRVGNNAPMDQPATFPAPDLAGARVLITGASSGIGAAAAEAFSAAGALVALAARRRNRLADVLTRCTPGSMYRVTELADGDDVDSLARWALDELGGVDVVVNNAGIPKRRMATHLSPEDLDEVMAVNFHAPVRLTAALVPHMVERGTGHVVNVSSMGVHMLAYRVGAYAASKAAIELYTEALHLELAGTGVRAHLFIPGSTATEFSTERPGNDAPFAQDPATADPRDVAAALVGCLASSDFRTFARDSDRAAAEAKEADVNGYIAARYAAFSRPR